MGADNRLLLVERVLPPASPYAEEQPTRVQFAERSPDGSAAAK